MHLGRASNVSLHSLGDMVNKNKRAWIWLWLSVFVIILDQFTKYIVVRHLSFGEPYVLLPFFNFNLNFNPGAAFSFLSQSSGWQIYLFSLISLVVIIFLLFWLAGIKRSNYLMAAGICLIIGGAVGNLIDRIRFKFVIDFLDFHIKTWHFDTFNVADSAICIGAFLIILHLLFTTNKTTG